MTWSLNTPSVQTLTPCIDSERTGTQRENCDLCLSSCEVPVRETQLALPTPRFGGSESQYLQRLDLAPDVVQTLPGNELRWLIIHLCVCLSNFGRILNSSELSAYINKTWIWCYPLYSIYVITKWKISM